MPAHDGGACFADQALEAAEQPVLAEGGLDLAEELADAIEVEVGLLMRGLP
ncbi:hypothetical protein [Sorangium sp. So ce1151]|uniref:hypothetical protein n=1 Tax=Sorangium sp. So ce1151 TaxID=3133332 RepID=UPI003F621B7C